MIFILILGQCPRSYMSYVVYPNIQSFLKHLTMKSFGYPSPWFLVSPTLSAQQQFRQVGETSSLDPGSPNQISSYPLCDMIDTEKKEVTVREEEGAANIGDAVISKSTGKRALNMSVICMNKKR